jgi:hypothetical protein
MSSSPQFLQITAYACGGSWLTSSQGICKTKTLKDRKLFTWRIGSQGPQARSCIEPTLSTSMLSQEHNFHDQVIPKT